MRITITIIASIFLSTLQDAPLSKLGKVKLPARLDHVSVEQIHAFEEANFKHRPTTRGLQHIYKTENIVFGFEDFDRPEKYAVSLENSKERMLGEVEEISVSGMTVTAEIVEYNSKRFLIRKAVRDDEFYYSFFSETTNGIGLRGGIQFKKVDQKNAEKLLGDFLKNIQYKKESQ